ncbi:hypothetical protein Pelo_14630 [Pelomyxa schiedti]|nr:hypothetical protein Pelo_14630 [Pelomyxa schiedti]
MKGVVAVAVAVVSLAIMGGAADPLSPTWPGSFFIQVTLAEPNITDPEPVHDTQLYYDWAAYQAQRIDHSANNHECTKYYNTTNPCSLLWYELPYPQLWVTIPSENRCLQDTSMNGIGPLPPDWMNMFIWKDQQTMGGYLCDHWVLQFPTYASEYWDRVSDAAPVRYSAGDEKEQWWFDPDTLVIGDQSEDLFMLPPMCYAV